VQRALIRHWSCRLGAAEVDESQQASSAEAFSVGEREIRARHNAVIAPVERPVDEGAYLALPRNTLDGRIDERPPEVRCQHSPQDHVSRSGRAHDDDHHRLQLWRIPVAPSSPDRPDAHELTPVVYDELRRLAGAYMRRERQGQTLQATALVHEAFLRLAGAGTPWTDRRHFIGIAARSMRQILVERARARGAQKRWAGMDRVSLSAALVAANPGDAMLPALDEALDRLEQIDPEQARIVELRYFVGLSVEEAAEVLAISPATLKRRWALARAWLFRELSGDRG
jgi:RNA polymerase sigma factor (TIGR02999 family)